MRATGICVQCKRKIGPLYMRPTEKFPRTNMPTRSGSVHHMDPQGFFCTLRCAARFGVMAAVLKQNEPSPAELAAARADEMEREEQQTAANAIAAAKALARKEPK